MRPLPIVLAFLLWTALAHAQRPSASVKQFAGCYEVTSLSWNPPDNRIKLIPPRFELSMQIFDDAYHVQPAPRNAPATAYMRLFSWKPAGHAVKISFNGGLGGWRGKLRQSRSGELAGNLKEWCDYRCGWKKRTGSIHLKRISCGD